MSISKWFASIVLAAAAVSTVSAETHCPGDVASLTFNLANRHQIIVPVSINHAGPFNFLLDTGTQMTMVDPALAAVTLAAGDSPLTPRERDVLAVARSGATVAEIATKLYLSEGTVRNYLSSAIAKTAARNRIDALRIADERGWL